MGGKKLLLLGGILAGLAVFVYFYEFRNKEAREQREQQKNKVLQLDSQVTRLSIQSKGEPEVVLERSGEQWKMTLPVQAAADSMVVSGVVQALTDIASDRTLDKPDLQAYGLKEPVASVEIEAGGKKHRLRFGDKDFTGGSVYLMRDQDPAVYLVPDTALTRVAQPAAGFRDKSVVSFDTEAVTRIELSRKEGSVALEKVKDLWRLKEPADDAADRATVESLLSSVRYATIQTFVQESLDNLKQYDLDPPAARVVLISGDKKTELNLGKAEGDNRYAFVPGRASVFTVPKDVFEKIGQPTEKFQSHEVVRLDRERVTRVEMKTEKEQWVAEKKGEQWKVTSPPGKDSKAFPEYRLFLALEDLKAEKLLAPNAVALGAPLVVCKISGGEPVQVEVFRKGEEWYARSSLSKRLFKISEAQGQALNDPVDKYLE